MKPKNKKEESVSRRRKSQITVVTRSVMTAGQQASFETAVKALLAELINQADRQGGHDESAVESVAG